MINKILVLIAMGALLSFGLALNYHFILMDNNEIKLLKKAELSIDKTLVDARGTNRLQLILDPVLVKAGVKDVIRDAVE